MFWFLLFLALVFGIGCVFGAMFGAALVGGLVAICVTVLFIVLGIAAVLIMGFAHADLL